jgi:hypothetical protein
VDGVCEPIEDASTEPDVDAPPDITDPLEEDDPVDDPVVDLTDPSDDEVEEPEEDVPADVPPDTPCTGPTILMTDTRVGTGVAVDGHSLRYAFVNAHWTGSEFGVTWEDSTMAVRLTRVSAGGSVTGTVSSIADAAGESRVPTSTWTGSNFGVAWQERGRPTFRVLGPDGTKLGSQVNLLAGESWYGSIMADVAWSGSEYGIVLDGDLGSVASSGLYFIRVSSSGAKIGMATEASTFITYHDHQSSIVWSGSEYGLAWNQPPVIIDQDLYFHRISPTGERRGPQFLVSTGTIEFHPPSHVWTGSEYGLAWSQTNDVYFARMAGDGTRIGSNTLITTATGIADNPDLIWTGSEYALAWSNELGGDDEVYAAFISGDGVKTSSDIRVSTGTGASNYPSLAWTGSAIGVFWKDGRAGYTDRYDLYHNQIGVCP